MLYEVITLGIILLSAVDAAESGSSADNYSTPQAVSTVVSTGTQVAYTSTGAAYVPGEVIVRYKKPTGGFSAQSVMSPGLVITSYSIHYTKLYEFWIIIL